MPQRKQKRVKPRFHNWTMQQQEPRPRGRQKGADVVVVEPVDVLEVHAAGGPLDFVDEVEGAVDYELVCCEGCGGEGGLVGGGGGGGGGFGGGEGVFEEGVVAGADDGEVVGHCWGPVVEECRGGWWVWSR